MSYFCCIECRWTQFKKRQIFDGFSVDTSFRSDRRRRICVSFASIVAVIGILSIAICFFFHFVYYPEFCICKEIR